MADHEDPHMPRECRVCGELVRVTLERSDRMMPLDSWVRHCDNPRCRFNTPNRRATDRP